MREEAIRDLERHGVPREYVRTVDTDFLFVPGTEPTDAIVLEGPVSQTVVELQTRCEDLRRELMETKAQLFNHLSGSRPGVGGLFS